MQPSSLNRVCASALAAVLMASAVASAQMSYLDNGVIEIGVNLNKGGAITYMADSGGDPLTRSNANVVNDYDLGRQIQMSYFVGPDDYNPYNCVTCDPNTPGCVPLAGCQHPAWSPFPWNPIQAGDGFGNGSATIQHTNDGNEIYIKCIPNHWHLNNVPGECYYETTITLLASTAHVSCRLTNNRTDTTQYPAKASEFPAVYTVGTLNHLYTYNGMQPFSSGALTEVSNVDVAPAPEFRATEHWAAFVNDNNWGIGVYNANCTRFAGAYHTHGNPQGTGGPDDPQCGIVVPSEMIMVDHNIIQEYEYTLILGNLPDIRSWVYQQSDERKPNYVFSSDRQYWYYPSGTADQGWPINGQLRVNLNAGSGTFMTGPYMAYRASDAPTLYIKARYAVANPPASPWAWLSWEKDNGTARPPEQSLGFTPIIDGQYHVYTLDVSSKSGYTGLISRFFFDILGSGTGGANDYVDIEYISYTQTGLIDPVIQLSETSFNHSIQQGSDLTEDTFTIRNSGGGTLNYSTTDNGATWLDVSSGDGSSTGEEDTIHITYTTAGLGPGIYAATIDVTSPNATNTPRSVTVSLEVTSGQSGPTPVFTDPLANTDNIGGQWGTGTFSSAGYTLSQSGGTDSEGNPQSVDYVYYDLDTSVGSFNGSGTIEFDIIGLASQSGVVDNHLAAACDSTGLNPGTTSGDFYLSNYYTIFGKNNESGSNHIDKVELDARENANYPGTRSDVLSWNGSTKYRFRVTWSGTQMRLYRGTPGNVLTEITSPLNLGAAWSPAILHIQIGATFRAGPRNINTSGGTPGSTYSCLRVYDTDIGNVATAAACETTPGTGEVTIDMGTSDVIDGLIHPIGADGNTSPTTMPPTGMTSRDCRVTDDPASDHYFYFRVDDSFAYDGNNPDLYITFDYYDNASSGSVILQYDSTDPTAGPTGDGKYKHGGSVAYVATNTWKQQTFHVADARFANRQNLDADFRIATDSGGDLYLDIVRVSASAPTSPVIELSTSSLDPSTAVGGSPPNDSFTVTNIGGSTLDYGVSGNQTWLSISPDHGANIGAADTINVIYNTGSLAEGDYPATITVTDSDATNSPQTIAVNLQVGSGGGSPLVLDDPLQGSTIGTRTDGSDGTFVAGGWQVDDQYDGIYWHLPYVVENGEFEFKVTGVGLTCTNYDCDAGKEKNELSHMYDWTFGSADTVYTGYRNNPHKQFIRKHCCAANNGKLEVLWAINNDNGDNYLEQNTAVLTWNAGTQYTFKCKWYPSGSNMVIEYYRNDSFVYSQSLPGDWALGGHAVRIGASPRRSGEGAPVGAIFSDVKVWDLSGPMPPAKAFNPNPPDLETEVSRSATLSWSAGDGATSHDVYFGTTNPPASQGNQAGTMYDPGFTLDANTTYYWQIDEVNGNGTATGDVWRFTTGTETGDAAKLYEPIEWDYDNPSWTGDAFDLVATATFTHTQSSEQIQTELFYQGTGTTWTLRFTGTLTGEWTYTTSCSDADLNGLSGSVEVLPNPGVAGFMTEFEHNGIAKWGRQGIDEVLVPQYVMYYDIPSTYHNNPAQIDDDIETFFGEHGFNGFHVYMSARWFDINNELTPTTDSDPDPRTLEALELLINKTHEAGGVVHIWAWGDNDGGSRSPEPLPGGQNGYVDQRVQRYICARLGPLPGWTMGYGWDLQEWATAAEIDTWHNYMDAHLGWHHYLGARSYRGDHPTQITELMDYSAYEQWKPMYDSSLENPSMGYVYGIEQHAPAKPSFWSDRFRVRPTPEPKDYTEEETRRGLYHSTLAGGAANIWGYCIDNGTKTYYSMPYPNKHWILTYSRLFGAMSAVGNAHRFTSTMERDNSLTDGYCLRDSNNLYIFYRENTNSISMDLTGMSGSKPAVAIDTTESYEELPLGTYTVGNQTFNAASTSDWVVVVGDPILSEVSIDLGRVDREAGLFRARVGDGDTVVVNQDGRYCRRNDDSNDDYYMYFNVVGSYAYEGSKPDLYITIDYYDTGSGSLTLQYDGASGSYSNGGSVTLAGSDSWETHTFHVTDADFSNDQNGGADFRIFGGAGETFYIDTVTVCETLPGGDPEIELSISSINRAIEEGDSLPSDTFTVTNVGDQTLNYTISDNAGWLEETPANGTSTGEADTINIIYSTTGLSVGNYSATISVEDPNATNSPQTISVNLEVTPAQTQADFDNDGDVDQEDFGHFQKCLTGSGVPAAPGCNDANLDGDGTNDVDTDDFAIFQQCMAGPNQPPGC